ncbi:MAG TPA: DUF2158 domain-containing protein [Rhizomicrobium sp.]|jgi:uncharacterized protein YodC (DUF2158 family)|nr:DUF2158 domain-containing protein [Rhizomicrobium sp.]
MPFKIGDLAVLKSGGVTMTVEEVSDDSVGCVWSDGKRVFREEFHPDTLMEGPPTTLEGLLAELDKEDSSENSN